jgi:polyphosphate kinase 2 (PPK2 family)
MSKAASAKKPPARRTGRRVSRAYFDRIAGALRTRLLGLQDQLKSEDFSVVILFAGSAVAGKNEALNLITEWMDPRWITTRAYGPPASEEQGRPEYWRYWRDLPPNGQIELIVGSWYHKPIHDRVYENSGKRAFLESLDGIREFERTLAADGTLILKFLLHIDKSALKKRMKAMEKDRLQSWRIGKQDWSHLKHHRKLEKANFLAAAQTDSPDGRWIMVDGSDPRRRALTVLKTVRDTLAAHIEKRRARRNRIERIRARAEREKRRELEKIVANLEAIERQSEAGAGAAGMGTAPRRALLRQQSVLDRLDMSRRLDENEYQRAVKAHRAELGDLFRKLHFKGGSAVILFEGPDAAGKGGAIRRLTSAMDARDYRVIQIAAPSEEERARHYLWRFWRHIPQKGRLVIFDRSWYGRVLVERVEGFAQPEEWRRGYGEINAFEEQLTSRGIIVLKFWIHVTKAEQYRRFKEREAISYKKWKLTAEDWRNREKWDDYGAAVDEMIRRTSTEAAPWTLVEGDDKKFARIKVMETVCAALRRGLAV